jgi:hypothetical protein
MSIRGKYEKYGVKKYYEEFGDSYKNPHQSQLAKGLPQAFEMTRASSNRYTWNHVI